MVADLINTLIDLNANDALVALSRDEEGNLISPLHPKLENVVFNEDMWGGSQDSIKPGTKVVILWPQH
jgi:hypothetical protein